MMMRIASVVAAVLLAATPTAAQDTLGNVLTLLTTNQAVQTGDFERDRAAADAAHDAIARALLLNLTSAPIAPPRAGFSTASIRSSARSSAPARRSGRCSSSARCRRARGTSCSV